MRAFFGIAALTLPGVLRGAAAQSVDVGGLAYVDYFYTLSSPTDDDEGFHGFTYRRLYLTTDITFSDDWRARARLEASESTLGPRGPVPYVKDLWIRWNFTGDHRATLGVTPPPVFDVEEDVWGYRSLEKTILDLQDVNDSRDFGIRFDGPLTSGGRLEYSVMVANNEGVNPESDKYKRGYAQLAFFPTESLSFTAGVHRSGYGDEREGDTRLSAFGGYVSDRFRIGLGAIWYRVTMVDADEFTMTGATLFGAVKLSPAWELVARADRTHEEEDFTELDELFLLAGLAYSPISSVQIIPNLWVFDSDTDDDAEALGRVTVYITF